MAVGTYDPVVYEMQLKVTSGEMTIEQAYAAFLELYTEAHR